MKIAFTCLLVLHGLIHSMGFLKAFGLADLPQLTQPISRAAGALWLVAGLLTLATAVLLHTSPRWWWVAGFAAVLVSEALAIGAWRDAKFATVANVIVLVGAVLGFFSTGPTSLRAEYESEAARSPGAEGNRDALREADLADLPPQVRRYLEIVGVVGHPKVLTYRVRFEGRIRGGPNDPWMPFSAEQTSFADRSTRLFFMDAKRMGLPVVALHAYVDGAASMRVKVLSAFSMVDARGPAFTQTETVTIFNDMCLMAPSALVGAPIHWKEIDATHVEGTFTNAGHTISATLAFAEDGRLVDFVSDDRPALAKDNVSFVKARWSTPVSKYRAFGPFQLPAVAEARYEGPSGSYAYGEMEIVDVRYDGD